MQPSNFVEATVLLFDRQRAVRKQTRSVLNVLGFKKFQEFQDLEGVRYTLCNQRVDVLVLTLESADCGVLRLVDDIRRQRCGVDPFVPILLTTWDAKLKAVRSVIESGADDILLYPFSTAKMGQRIENLVQDRKPFVVTDEYFGPDRRAASLLQADPTSVTVPNALAAQVLGQHDVAPNAARIDATLSELRRLKLRNLARRIWYLAETLKLALPDPSLPDRYERELLKLGKAIRRYRKTLTSDDAADLTSLCESLDRVVARLFGKPPEVRGMELLEQSALALRVASRLDHEPSETGDAISEAVASSGDIENALIQAVMG